MTLIQAQGCFERLVEQTRILASSSDEQSAYMSSIYGTADEMRMCFLDLGSELFPLYRQYDLIDNLDERAVLAVEKQLNSGKGDKAHYHEFFYDWSRAKDLTFWVETRRLANLALGALQRPRMSGRAN